MKYLPFLILSIASSACSNGGSSGAAAEYQFTLPSSSSDNSSESIAVSSDVSQSSEAGDPVPESGFQLIDFKLIGSDGNGGQTSVDPYLDEGEFGFTWENMDFRTPYRIKTFVSSDSQLTDDDILFLSLDCTQEGSFTCGPNNSSPGTSCVFSSTHEIACDGLEENYDISSLITELPIQLFIVLESCHAISNECSTLAAELVFQ